MSMSSKVRIAAAASAVAAAGFVAPATVASATPAVPAPTAIADLDCTNPFVCVVDEFNDSPTQNTFFWFGKSNPNFEPLFGFVFPNIFGLDFEACFIGGAVHLSPYTGGFIGVGRGC